jgi:hypothetical protein
MCKLRRAKPRVPQMGDMPAVRLQPFVKPFSYVIVDYFRPIDVTIGRKTDKRYGALFSCLSTRTIHIEIAHALTTDSCIMCVRNFFAVRGYAIEMWSDNGRNFLGASNELKREVEMLDKKFMQEQFIHKGVKWNFITARAPHMAGAVERMVQSVKRALFSSLDVLSSRHKRLTDETLRNFLMEAMFIVNCRPLTYIPVEDNQEEVLTPNHFLLGSSSGAKAPGKFIEYPNRQNWKSMQYMANIFWQKWIK